MSIEVRANVHVRLAFPFWDMVINNIW
jgi:hypothetical protein